MSNEYLKEEFCGWMSRQVQNNGKPYSTRTQNHYINSLERKCNQIKDLNIENTDLFNITSFEEFKTIDKMIRENKAFKKVYEDDHGTLSSAMIKYGEFLQKRNKVVWFVGAFIDGEDQTERFINEGIWENGYKDKYTDYVEDIKVGHRIAIKATYTRKKNLPFDNKGQVVSVMGIKAIGVVTHNFNDGHKISVEWEKFDQRREWYFFTGRNTIWKVDENDGWMYKDLIDFTFNNKTQNINRFINHPYWIERFGQVDNLKYRWTTFYEEISRALLKYKNNRLELINGIKQVFDNINKEKVIIKNYILDKEDSELHDICPFTVLGLFNRGITDEHRKLIMHELAKFLEVEEPVPTSFGGVPLLHNMRSCFFGDKGDRKEEDIDNLWELFEIAIKFAENYTEENRKKFIEVYNKVIKQFCIKWNITMGLYWIKPWDYITLDTNTRNTLCEKFNISGVADSYEVCTGEEYIKLIEFMKDKFEEEDCEVNSFPELAYISKCETIKESSEEYKVCEEKCLKYTKEDFLNEVFISDEYYEIIRSLLKRKKNIILQGAPGVGKTYVAKRLAWSIMGEVDIARIEMVQFHQSYSYEDFIEGYMPTEKGFELKRGSFYKFCKLASKNQEKDYYFIIDEINRGNMSKIFGELMMLIESDKREEELTLTYSNEKFSVPKNLYIIGMMNTADRSLAIIDYALRRRFCFIDLEPAFDTNKFKEHLLSLGASEELVNKIKSKMMTINSHITKDVNLGKDFRIGHSYFCNYSEDDMWYEDVINYEIAPLIREYWFDDEDKANNHIEKLLRG